MKKQKDYTIHLLIIIFLIACLASCRTSGYGCRGNESWKQMTKRINKP